MSPLLIVGVAFAGGFLLAAGLADAVARVRELLEEAADALEPLSYEAWCQSQSTSFLAQRDRRARGL